MTYCVDKEPVLCIDSFLIEEKGRTDESRMLEPRAT
jgi:hypothetical protein